MISPITVTELSKQIKSVIENDFRFVFVVGEISNFKHHISSGHYYFTLKDEASQINSLMWKTRNVNLFFTPENGMKVEIKGRITLYESRGCYQIEVFEMKPFGVGELQIAFDNLKRKLFDEGLFDDEYKKPIPEFPENVALITSETGAALQDFIKVTKKRYPIVKLKLYNVNVQGKEASSLICKAIKKLNRKSSAFDLIVIMRGGGSIEDLWCFNDESLVREIFASKIPVVSAIGHEVDFTICDFVSDLRAPTPSAAAEMIFPDIRELNNKIISAEAELKYSVGTMIDSYKDSLEHISKSYIINKPKDILNEYKFRFDEYSKNLNSCLKEKIIFVKNELNNTNKLFNSLNPEQVLKRGYTIVIKKGKIISRKKLLKGNDNVSIKFHDGETGAIITEQMQLNLKNN